MNLDHLFRGDKAVSDRRRRLDRRPLPDRTQSLGTGTSTGRLMPSVIAAVGQAEREAVLERQREGIARLSGRDDTRAVRRPHDDRRQRSSGSRRQASGPRKSPSD